MFINFVQVSVSINFWGGNHVSCRVSPAYHGSKVPPASPKAAPRWACPAVLTSAAVGRYVGSSHHVGMGRMEVEQTPRGSLGCLITMDSFQMWCASVFFHFNLPRLEVAKKMHSTPRSSRPSCIFQYANCLSGAERLNLTRPGFQLCIYLVGSFNHLEKYESQWEGLSHILWKIKMFETTNQLWMSWCFDASISTTPAVQSSVRLYSFWIQQILLLEDQIPSGKLT